MAFLVSTLYSKMFILPFFCPLPIFLFNIKLNTKYSSKNIVKTHKTKFWMQNKLIKESGYIQFVQIFTVFSQKFLIFSSRFEICSDWVLTQCLKFFHYYFLRLFSSRPGITKNNVKISLTIYFNFRLSLGCNSLLTLAKIPFLGLFFFSVDVEVCFLMTFFSLNARINPFDFSRSFSVVCRTKIGWRKFQKSDF